MTLFSASFQVCNGSITLFYIDQVPLLILYLSVNINSSCIVQNMYIFCICDGGRYDNFRSLCVLDKKKTTMSLPQLSTDTPAKLLDNVWRVVMQSVLTVVEPGERGRRCNVM